MFMKFLENLFSAIALFLLASCTSGNSSDEQNKDSLPQNVVVADTNKTAAVAVDTNTNPKLFFLEMYSVLLNNDSANWKKEFTAEQLSKFKDEKDLHDNFVAWHGEMIDFVKEGCNGDPNLVVVNDKNDGSLEFVSGKRKESIKAKIENGKWKLNER